MACLGATLRGSVIGFVAGVLPGAGASLGSFAAYVLEKRYSDRGTFGTGDPRGLAAPEAGNNAAGGGALVPMLALGVPGSGTTAVLLALLIALNITPGPLLFEQRPEVAWGLIASLYFANVVLLILNLPLVGVFVRLLMIPTYGLSAVATPLCPGWPLTCITGLSSSGVGMKGLRVAVLGCIFERRYRCARC